MVKSKARVHFMGIGGSGMSSAAVLAARAGYEVSGCDPNEESQYLDKARNERIPIFTGHCVDHLDEADIVVFTPAIQCSPTPIPELETARKRGIALTWQEFMGRYLQAGKRVVGVAGTHGKSTTTALLGSILEGAGLDPTVELGAIVKDWGSNVRVGESDLFVCEADEYNRNFHNYHPDVMLINNIEMDHPEFFADYADFRSAFDGFLQNISGRKILVANLDSEGVRGLLADNRKFIQSQGVHTVGFSQSAWDVPCDEAFTVSSVRRVDGLTEFELTEGDGARFTFRFTMPGLHNLENAIGAIVVARKLGVDAAAVNAVTSTWSGIHRRLDLVGEADGVRIYDDYAHHPTAVAASLEALRWQDGSRELWAVMEFHQVSRLRLFFDEFTKALAIADKVVITDYFLGREQGKEAVDPALVVEAIGADKAAAISGFRNVAEYVAERASRHATVAVLGAGYSYKISRMILSAIESRREA